MGRAKMLLPWGRSSVLGHLIQQWQALQARQIAVVCAADDQPIQAELTRLGFPEANRILNAAPEEGMFSSIQCAARWTGWQPGLTHWTIVLGDQPHICQQTWRSLIESCAIHPASVCQPRYHGHRHHPVFLPKSVFAEAATTQAANLKDFLETVAAKPFLCELDDPALELDIDRPEDYQEALARYGPRT
jgi:molybdenum cofactor cytidylyltransferase